jgi:hypothetical protein
MSSPVSRGFRHLRRPSAGEEGRVPPGQYVTQGFPVLSADPTPHTPLPEWTFSIRQGQNYLYVLAAGLNQIVGYRLGPGGSLTQVTTVPVATGSAGVGVS